MALTDSLISYWKFDESSGNAADSVGANTLTNNNSTAYGTGRVNNGADLEAGSSQSFSIADASQSGLDITGNISISGWFKLESTPSAGNLFIFAAKMASAGDNGWQFLYAHDETAIKFGYWDLNSGGGSRMYITKTLSTGVWYHIAVTAVVATQVVTIYVDGVGVVATNEATNATAIRDNASAFTVGAYSGGGQYFDGVVDEVGVWSRAINAGEVATLFYGGNGIQYPFSLAFPATDLVSYWKFDESSGNAIDAAASNDLTNNNSTAFGTGIINNGADIERASDNYFSIADASQSGLDLPDAASFSFWVKLESLPGNGEEYGFISKRTTSTRQYSISYENTGGTRFIEYNAYNNDTNLRGVMTLNYTLDTGVWFHIVIVRAATGDIKRIYINGLNRTLTSSSTQESIANGASDFRLGRKNEDGSTDMDGLIDEVGIWSRAISYQEVVDLFNSGAAMPYPSSPAVSTAKFFPFLDRR